MTGVYIPKYKKTSKNKYYLKNERIRYPELRVIDENGENIGVVKTALALDQAKDVGLDLIVISEDAKPPVAKILDFNKYLYEQSKKASQIKAKSKKSKLKEFTMTAMIDDGAIEIKANRAKEFLQQGHRVKVTVTLRGRQQAYPELAFEKIEKFTSVLGDIAKKEDEVKRQGRNVFVTFIKA